MSKETILALLQDSRYDEALKVAQSEDGISADAILKEQWLLWQSQPNTVSADRAVTVLNRITDKAWVVKQCMSCIFDDYNIQEALVNTGVNATQPIVDKIINDILLKDQDTTSFRAALDDSSYTVTVPLSDLDCSWILSKMYLLQYSDRLRTFEEIWSATNVASIDTLPSDDDDNPLNSSTEMLTSSSIDTSEHQYDDNTNENGFGSGYRLFRDVNLVAQAIEFARLQNFTALDILFSRHGTELLPYRLHILSQIPETADPERYNTPSVQPASSACENLMESTWDVHPWREDIDVVEHPKLKEYLKNLKPSLEVYESNLENVLQSVSYPASAETISQWYIERARRIDEFTGLTSYALKLIQNGSMRQVPNLQDLEDNLEFLCKLLYGTGVTAETERLFRDLDLQAFESMDPYEVLELSLKGTGVDRIVMDLIVFGLPWLQLVENRRTRDADGDAHMSEANDFEEPVHYMLYRWLLNVADGHLDWCCEILESSKPTMEQEDRIIKEDLDLSRIALAILYTTEDGSQVELMGRIFECLPLFDLDNLEDPQEEENLEVDTLADIQTAHGFFAALQKSTEKTLSMLMDKLQVHLSSAEVLWRYQLNVPLRWYLQSAESYDEQKQLCLRLANQVVSNVEKNGNRYMQDDDWTALLVDMMDLQDQGNGVLGAMSEEEIFEIYWKALLRCGNFNLAKATLLPKYGSKPISIEKAQQLIVDASREYFDNSNSGNMYHGNMKLASDCLNVVPTTAAIKQEANLIEATHHLTTEFNVFYRPGIPIMPMQVRQSKNRLELISRLLSSNSGAYRKSARIIDLAKKLGLQDDKSTEIRVLNMLSAAALAEEDYETSYKLCKTTLAKVVEVESEIHNSKLIVEMKEITWSSCFQLGKLEVYQDKTKRLELLAMALILCPADRLSENLSAWRKLEARAEKEADNTSGASASPQQGGWNTVSNLLQTGLQGQRNLAQLLSNEAGNFMNTSDMSSPGNADRVRKRDLLKNTVSKWLF
ncbi:hypothetical protein INT43_000823 [Umbelopsis isabellina]|uniref:Sec39 domain-containing protein n=1 Tax=Mortierella isabellina TaxID=91625 RepID=A0A8H7UJ04_MORIS|nr:hypothetical protein INT43_000823 [Umbelopsis isabellina]